MVGPALFAARRARVRRGPAGGGRLVGAVPHALGARRARGGREPGGGLRGGRDPHALQYQALFVAGVLGGLAGAHLSLGVARTWAEWMTAGRGFIAVALVIFSKWHPLRAVGGRRALRGRHLAAAPDAGARRAALALPARHAAVRAEPGRAGRRGAARTGTPRPEASAASSRERNDSGEHSRETDHDTTCARAPHRDHAAGRPGRPRPRAAEADGGHRAPRLDHRRRLQPGPRRGHPGDEAEPARGGGHRGRERAGGRRRRARDGEHDQAGRPADHRGELRLSGAGAAGRPEVPGREVRRIPAATSARRT